MDARDVDLSVTRMRRPQRDGADPTAGGGRAAGGGGRGRGGGGRGRGGGGSRAAGGRRADPAEGSRAGWAGYATDGTAALAVAPEPRPARSLPVGGPEQARSPEPPRLAVAPPPPVAVPRTPFVVLVLLVVVGGVVGILLLNTKVNENAFILHDLQQEQTELDQRQQRLEEQLARADSPAQLVPAANRLGLVRAEQLAYVRLPSGDVVFEPVPADGQPSRTSQADERED